MADMDNVKLLTLTQSESAAELEHLKRSIDSMIESGKLVARYRRAMYVAYLAEGFTEMQALELCTL